MATKKRELLILGTGRLALFSLAFFGNGKGNASGYSPDESECQRLNASLKDLRDEDLKKALLRKRLYYVSNRRKLVEANILILAYDGTLDANEELFSSFRDLLKDNENEEITLVIRSLARPGTARKIREFCEKEFENKTISVISIPDISDPESTYRDELNPYRVMIGSRGEESKIIRPYYNAMRSKGAPIYEVSNEEAEIASLASKLYLAEKAAFGSALLKEANKEGAEISHLVELLGSDPRISRRGLNPQELFAYSDKSNFEGIMPEFVDLVEEKRQESVADLFSLIKKSLGSLEQKKLAIIGLGKTGLEDSWSQRLYNLLKDEKADAVFFDFSLVKEEAFQKINPEAKVSKDFFETADNADAIIIFDGSTKLKKLLESDLLKHMKGRIIFDYAKALNTTQFKYFDIYRFGVRVKKRLSEEK